MLPGFRTLLTYINMSSFIVRRGCSQIILGFLLVSTAWGQNQEINVTRTPLITIYNPGLTPNKPVPVFIDLDLDGDPDVLQTFTHNGIPVQWIDDDDDMHLDDRAGDTDNDCLMVDRNRDGKYGDYGDFIVDWNDEDLNGKADMQVIADNRFSDKSESGPGHFMISLDTDEDGVFNYIDWASFKIEAWEHSGRCNFFQDYSGQSMFLKIHASTFDIDDLRFNWENPFLFYDEDGDRLTEMAIRLVDSPRKNSTLSLSGQISEAYITLDIDNDSRPQNEFDFDMSLKFKGVGFEYKDHGHEFKSLRGLPEADIFFMRKIISTRPRFAFRLTWQRS